MGHLNSTSNSQHIQISLSKLRSIISTLYHSCAPVEVKERKNVHLCKVSDVTILTIAVYQVLYFQTSQRRFLSYFDKHFPVKHLEPSRFNRRLNNLVTVMKYIEQELKLKSGTPDFTIIDSFPMPLCNPVRRYTCKVLEGIADQGYNATKRTWFYGLKVHMLVSDSGFIENYSVTKASVHDSTAIWDVIDQSSCPIILADMGYLGKELHDELENYHYHLWTPLRKNMIGVWENNRPELMVMRKSIETVFSQLCSYYDIEHPLARTTKGINVAIELAVFAHNLSILIN